MTRLLEQAFAAAARLPSEEQDALARALLEDLASEQAIDVRLAATPASLANLADEALAEHRRGETEPLDPDAL